MRRRPLLIAERATEVAPCRSRLQGVAQLGCVWDRVGQMAIAGNPTTESSLKGGRGFQRLVVDDPACGEPQNLCHRPTAVEAILAGKLENIGGQRVLVVWRCGERRILWIDAKRTQHASRADGF